MGSRFLLLTRFLFGCWRGKEPPQREGRIPGDGSRLDCKLEKRLSPAVDGGQDGRGCSDGLGRANWARSEVELR